MVCSGGGGGGGAVVLSSCGKQYLLRLSSCMRAGTLQTPDDIVEVSLSFMQVLSSPLYLFTVFAARIIWQYELPLNDKGSSYSKYKEYALNI